MNWKWELIIDYLGKLCGAAVVGVVSQSRGFTIDTINSMGILWMNENPGGNPSENLRNLNKRAESYAR